MQLSLKVGLLLMCCPLIACEEPKKPQVLKEDQALEVEPVAKVTPRKKKRAPIFEIDESGAKVGYERFMIDRPNGLAAMKEELAGQRDYIADKELAVNINRKAQLTWIRTYFAALEEQGATGFVVTTKTRSEYPKSLSFTALGRAKDAPNCSVVSMIGEDRSTSTWRLSGGKARQRRRGLGGPDLSMTATTIESVAGGCKKSDTLFVSAAEDVKWGLVYDLAASTAGLEKASFSSRALLNTTPTPGKKVHL